jgi:protein-tyrosine phosphatase
VQLLSEPLVDIHCHLLPGIDDGAASWDESLAMARMAVADGIRVIIATPHQLGSFPQNRGAAIRTAVEQLQHRLDDEQIPLRVVPGADVRIEPDLVARLASGDVLSLGDTGKYVLLELPHEIFFPLDRLLDELAADGYVGILSHPERNEGILANPQVLQPLVAKGCLLQITADSLRGTFGARCRQLSETLIQRGLAHFVSSDAHGTKHRRPLLGMAFDRVVELSDVDTALALCCRNPACVVDGTPIPGCAKMAGVKRASAGWMNWLGRKKAA